MRTPQLPKSWPAALSAVQQAAGCGPLGGEEVLRASEEAAARMRGGVAEAAD